MKRRKKKGQRLKHSRSEAMREKKAIENKIMPDCGHILEASIKSRRSKITNMYTLMLSSLVSPFYLLIYFGIRKVHPYWIIPVNGSACGTVMS